MMIRLNSCFAFAALLILSQACSLFPVYPAKPVPEDTRARFGKMGIVTLRVDLSEKISEPTAGWLKGMGVGTLKGAAMLIIAPTAGAAAGGSGGPYGSAVGLALGGVFGVIYFPVSVVAGAATAPTKEEVARDRTKIKEALDRLEFESYLHRTYRSFARREAGVQLEDLGVHALETLDPDLPGLAIARERGCQSCVLVEVIAMPSERRESILDLDAAYAMTVVVRLRVMLEDGEVVYDGQLIYDDINQSHRFSAWAAKDARRLTNHLTKAAKALSERHLEEIFLHYTASDIIHDSVMNEYLPNMGEQW